MTAGLSPSLATAETVSRRTVLPSGAPCPSRGRRDRAPGRRNGRQCRRRLSVGRRRRVPAARRWRRFYLANRKSFLLLRAGPARRRQSRLPCAPFNPGRLAGSIRRHQAGIGAVRSTCSLVWFQTWLIHTGRLSLCGAEPSAKIASTSTRRLPTELDERVLSTGWRVG